MRLIQEFKEFATRGNVFDMAAGIIIGGAFGTVVKLLVDDILMPPMGKLLGNVPCEQAPKSACSPRHQRSWSALHSPVSAGLQPRIPAMQVRSSIKRLSADCQIVKRRGVLYVICKKNPRFKQKQKCSPRNQTSSRRQNWRNRRLGAPHKAWKRR